MKGFNFRDILNGVSVFCITSCIAWVGYNLSIYGQEIVRLNQASSEHNARLERQETNVKEIREDQKESDLKIATLEALFGLKRN